MMKTTKKTHGGKRDGAGRKRKYDEYAKLSVSLDASLLAKLDEYRFARELTRSDVIQRCLQRLLRTK